MPVATGGRYELGDLIATGGLGEVYRAWDKQLQRKVALKRIMSGGPVPGEAYARALTEATHLAALQHPNIVSVYDFGMDERGPYVVMELVEGETLEAVAGRAAFPEADFLRLARESLDGLAAAHAIGLLHRDLKPGNLMLKWGTTSGFQVKLLDFGLSKISEKPSLQTRLVDNSVFGSIHYMAPEQFEGKVFDQRTDLYALGCLFYYALTRSSPFTGETVTSVMAAHLGHTFVPLDALRPDLSRELADWVTRLFALRPDDRHESASAALVDLERITAPKLPEPPPPQPMARAKVVVPAFVLGAVLSLAWVFLIQPLLMRGNAEAETPPRRVPVNSGPVEPTPEPPGVRDILDPAGADKPLDAGDTAALREHLGQTLTVEGVIVGMNQNQKGDVRYLNFGADYRTSLSLVFLQSDVRKDASTEQLRVFIGKRVRAEGTLAERQGALRLMVDQTRQVKVIK